MQPGPVIVAPVRGSEQCQGHGSRTVKPRRVSALLSPVSANPPAVVDSAPASAQVPSPARESESSLAIDAAVPSDELPSPALEPVPALATLESVPASAQVLSSPLEPVPSPAESIPTQLSSPPLEPVSSPPSSPVLWQDWPARSLRGRWMKLLCTETVLLTMGAAPAEKATERTEQSVLTRAERAHWRLSWSQRLARNARGATAPPLARHHTWTSGLLCPALCYQHRCRCVIRKPSLFAHPPDEIPVYL
jgi:hypothetical protein